MEARSVSMDELDRLLWKKAVELSAREGRPRCCTVGYTPGYVLRDGSQ